MACSDGKALMGYEEGGRKEPANEEEELQIFPGGEVGL